MPKLSKDRKQTKTLHITLFSFRKVYLVLLLFLSVGSFVFYTSLTHSSYSLSENYGSRISDLSGNFNESDKLAYYNGQQVESPRDIPRYLAKGENADVLGETTGEERWIEIDLSEQKLIAHDGDNIFLETPVSSGLIYTPTPQGEFRIWIKLKSTKMSGGEGKTYYYLPNVPYVMFFGNSNVPGYKGYSLHGTYWHNDFGNPRSHGCVNLPTPIAEKLFYWVNPVLGDNKNIIRATEENPGTRIVIHE